MSKNQFRLVSATSEVSDEGHDGGGGGGVDCFAILRQTPVAANPREEPFLYPASGVSSEADLFLRFAHDLDTDRTGVAPLLSRIAEPDERPTPVRSGLSLGYKKDQNTRRVIRDTLDTIEKIIRFEIVRLMSCYCTVLMRVFEEIDFAELLKSVPPLMLYLEVCASDRSMISFMGLGLSRVTVAILNDATANKGMTVPEARTWLRGASLEADQLSPLLIEEIRRAVR